VVLRSSSRDGAADEVKDIDPPASIMNAMKAEAEAERKKRYRAVQREHQAVLYRAMLIVG
jgi:regulator of protease activity HflC (stomatin/prohibitin superfamily)